jgi:hypothetical protein
MGLTDKMKVQYEQALTMAQQGVSQGKAKLDQAQAKYQRDRLLRNLGAAVWAEEREGGPSDAVTAALAALDAHSAAHPASDEDGPEGGDAGPDGTGPQASAGPGELPTRAAANPGTSEGASPGSS